MKTIVTLLCFLILFSCKDDKDEIDCSLIDIQVKMFLIKVVDSEGNNLIEDETYIANDISIIYNNNTITNVVIKNFEDYKNLIGLNIFGVEGENTFIIKLSEEEMDTLVLNLSFKEAYCGLRFYTLNSATYNNKSITFEDFHGNYLITVVK